MLPELVLRVGSGSLIHGLWRALGIQRVPPRLTWLPYMEKADFAGDLIKVRERDLKEAYRTCQLTAVFEPVLAPGLNEL